MATTVTQTKPKIGRRKKYPVKKTINLMYKEKKSTDLIFTVGLFLVYMVCLYLFSKYCVSAQLQKADAAESYYNQKLRELQKLQEDNEQFGDVRVEYSHYGNGFLTEEESSLQDRVTMLNVIDQRVHTTGGIQNIKITDNVAQINLGVSDANYIPEIIKALEESEFVSYVTAQTASTVDVDSSKLKMTVDAEGNVLAPLYVDASITVQFRTPQEVNAAIVGGTSKPVDAYLDASPTGYATGDNVYVPTIIETVAETEAETQAQTRDVSDTSKAKANAKASSSSGSSSNSKSQQAAAQQAAQRAAQAAAAQQAAAQAAAQQQAAAQAAAQQAAAQQAAAQAAAINNQMAVVDTPNTNQFGGSISIQGGSPLG